MNYPPDLLELVRVLVGVYQEDGDEVRQYGQDVYHVHPTLEELPLFGAGGEPQDVLEGEPGDADGLHHGELRVVDLLPVIVVSGEARDCV